MTKKIQLEEDYSTLEKKTNLNPEFDIDVLKI